MIRIHPNTEYFLTKLCFCLSNAMHSIGKNIKSVWHIWWCPSGVRPSAGGGRRACDVIYRPIFTKFGTYLLRAIEKKKIFEAVRPEVVYAHAQSLIDCHLQDVVFGYIWGLISPKQFKIARRCQRNTNRKSHTASRTMTSRDPKGQRNAYRISHITSRMAKQASKLTDLSYMNYIMLLYREALDRLRVRSNIILFHIKCP